MFVLLWVILVCHHVVALMGHVHLETEVHACNKERWDSREPRLLTKLLSSFLLCKQFSPKFTFSGRLR